MSQLADGHFPSTHWTLIERIKGDDAEARRKALDELCSQYHYPLYCYLRRRGLSHHDAQDALHDFLARFLQAGSFAAADAERGRLRAFLSASLGRFLINWRRDRPHRHREVSSDAEQSLAADEGRYVKERFTDEDTPDRVFDRKWAQTLLQQVLKNLERDYAARDRGALFGALRPVLLHGGSLRGENPAALAEKLGMAEGALRTALNRLLRDYREALKREVRQTVTGDEDVKDELRRLLQIFSGK